MAHGDRRKALIVGINEYPKKPLKGCENDARAMHRVLRRHEKQDPNFDCLLFVQSEVQITSAFLEDRIKSLLNDQSDIALLYFSGHGRVIGTKYYLVTCDATDGPLGIDLDWVMEEVQKSPAKEVVIVLDCCHAGGVGNLARFEVPTAQLRQGVAILAATEPDDLAAERSGKGKFTDLLVRGLSGAAIDLVGHVTTSSLYAYADGFLTLWEQRPVYKAHLAGLTALRYCYPKVKKEYLRMVTDLFPKPDSIFSLDFSQPSDPEQAPVPAKTLRILRLLRRQGLVEGVQGFTITKEMRLHGACRLTSAGRDLHNLVLKNKI